MTMKPGTQAFSIVASYVMIVGGIAMVVMALLTLGSTSDFVQEQGHFYNESTTKAAGLGYPMNDTEILKAESTLNAALDLAVFSLWGELIVLAIGLWFSMNGVLYFILAWKNKPTVHERIKVMEQVTQDIVAKQATIGKILKQNVDQQDRMLTVMEKRHHARKQSRDSHGKFRRRSRA